MGRRAWQGLFGWWKPGRTREESGQGSGGAERPVPSEAVVGWTRLEAASLESTGIASLSQARVATLGPANGDAGDSIEAVDPEDEELAAFLAADYEPVEANPEFKRKLRDQLWSLIQSNEMTRQ